MIHGLWHAKRYLEARGRANALAAPYAGERSIKKSVSTYIMSLGLVMGVGGLFLPVGGVVLVGMVLFFVGLMWAVVEGLLDMWG
jgi:hypothetical protein